MPYYGSSIDEQVVKMSFDNSNFDSNVNDSIKTLNNLDKRLAIFDNKESLSNINASFNNLANTFTVKGQIMFGVLTSLGKELYNIGRKALGTITKGMRDGFGEYKQIIDSTESIYQNVKQNGNSLQDVNNALDELNDYADKTIYNFGQMTRMIGMFSSAGVGLKDSVNSIKGLSNAAALVGANMQRAQIGWNAVSRAMSSGKFTNVTWRSLELSNIAGKQFNKVITEVARTMKVKGKQTGKDIDGMIKKWGSLRESLREGWLTKDVFAEAMTIMANDMSKAEMKRKGYSDKQIKELKEIAEAAEEAATKVKTFQQLMETVGEAVGSGWAQSFRILLGDLEQAKKLYTRISNVISDFIDNNANIRNELFKKIVNGKDKSVDGKWKSGRDNFRQIIENMLAIIKTFLKSVKTGFLNIFPIDRIATAARKFLDIFEKFTRSFVLNSGKVTKAGETLWNTSDIDEMSEAIKDLIKFFRGLASAIDIAWMAISQPIKVIIKRIPYFNDFFGNTNKGILGIVKSLGQFGDKITAFRDASKDWEIFGYVTEYVLDNIDELAKKYPVLGMIVGVFRALKNAANGLKTAFKQMDIKPLSAIFGAFKMVVTSVWNILNRLFGILRSAKSNIDWSWLEGPKNVFKNILKILSDYGRGLINFENTCKKIGNSIGGIFSTLSSKLIKVSNKSNKINTATGSIEKQFSDLDVVVDNTGNKIYSVWDKIKSLFASISDFFKGVSKNSNNAFDGIAKKVALIGGGVAAAAFSITHLTKAFKKINILNNISDLLNAGIDVLNAYQKQAQSKIILNIAIAVGILAGALVALSFVPYEKLENGLAVFTAFMAILSMTLTTVINSLTRLNEALGKSKKVLTQFDVLNNLTNQVGQIGLKLAKGFNKQSLGKMFKDIAVSIFILVGALAALVLLFKADKDNTITAIKALAKIIVIMAASVAVLTLAMNAFSRTAQSTAGAFSGFLKLTSVSGIILSLAAAVAILVGSLYIVAKIDSTRLEASWKIIRNLVIIIGIIATVISAIVSKINLGDTGKLKKITIKLTGVVAAMAAVIAGIAALVHIISKDNTKSWWPALLSIVGVMSAFSLMMISIMTFAKQLGGKERVWNSLNKTILTMTVCMLSLVAGLYALSYAKRIPASIVATIGIITVATTVLLTFIAYLTAQSKGNGFATDFVKVIQGLSIAVSALTISLGIMAAGLAAFIAAINSLDISTGDAKKASNSIIKKLEYAGEVIEKSIPGLKTLFTKLGKTAAEIFTSFTTAFFNTVVEIGDKYDDIIEKVVNLIINILGKVSNTLRTRKDDVAKIIGDIVEFLGTEIAAVVNSFFSKDGKQIVSSEQILNWIGIGGIALAVGNIILDVLKNFNAIVLAVKNFDAAWKAFKGLDIVIKFSSALGKLKAFLSLFWETQVIYAGSAGWAITALIAGITAIITGVIALIGAWKRFTGEVKDSYEGPILSLKGIEQVIVDGWKKVANTIFTGFMTVANIIIGTVSSMVEALATGAYKVIDIFGKVVGFFNKDAGKSISNWNEKNLGYFSKTIHEATVGTFKQIDTDLKYVAKDWAEAFNIPTEGITKSYKDASKNLDGLGDELSDKVEDANKQLRATTKNEKEANYNSAKDNFENYKKGAEDALDGMGDELANKIENIDKQVIATEMKDFEEHSPSKKSYNIYWNYILGAKNALSEGGKELVRVMESNNNKLIKTTITGSKNVEEAYNKVGANLGKREGLNQYKVSYNSYEPDGKAEYKTVELNKELTEQILAQKEALRGKNKEEIKAFINQQAIVLGLKDATGEAGKLIDYLFKQQTNQTALAWNSVEQLEKQTQVSWAVILSAEEEASMAALNKQIETNKQLIDIAEDKKKQLIGKSKDQAKQIIKDELIARGMSEEQAEEEAHKMVALMVSKQKQKKTIEASGLNRSILLMQAETGAYEASLKEQTELLEKEIEKRGKLQENAANWQKKAESGQVDPSNYKEYVNAQREYIQQKDRVNGLKNQLNKIVEETAKKMAKDKTLNSGQFEKDYADAYKKISANNKKSGKSLKETLSNWWKDATGKIPKAIDPSTWNLGNGGNNTNNLKDNGKKAVDAAKDTKKKLEANRADLTPTFDLDKLSDEAKKANGIVTSSLMAAQNASIGDYINKDSELNPFMKDRWQNVYNFTQNNYSPKALSRIDIYRQTQRQLNLSRGF